VRFTWLAQSGEALLQNSIDFIVNFPGVNTDGTALTWQVPVVDSTQGRSGSTIRLKQQESAQHVLTCIA
jgi:hypothetical protein